MEKIKFLINFLDHNRIVPKLGELSLFRFHFEGLDICKKCFCSILHIDSRKLKKAMYCLFNNLVPKHNSAHAKVYIFIYLNHFLDFEQWTDLVVLSTGSLDSILL